MDLTLYESFGLLLLILGLYGIASYQFRRVKVSKFGLISARIAAVAATIALIVWPMVYDLFFVEHFPDEATMPGPAFAMFFFLIFVTLIWGVYALLRIVQNTVTEVRT
jgi:hypothetical protein